MKALYIPIVFLLFSFSAISQTDWTIYYSADKCISAVLPEYYNSFEPKSIATDLAIQLHKATGMKFNSKEFNGTKGTGIYLLLDPTKDYSSNEEAYINSDNQTYITISAKYATGLSYGVYTMLNRLGFRFYLPGDIWTITPNLKSFFYGRIETRYFPAFKDRRFAGYFPNIKGIDEENRNNKIWLTWCQRNRMGSEYLALAGHVGETYNSENSALLIREPERLAPVNGKREFSILSKIDPTTKKSVEDFTDWAIRKFTLQRNIPSSCFPPYIYQSVDLGDGVNYCHTPDCERTFKSVSDQAYYIANIAARKIKQVDNTASVNLYAYGERADTPTIKIEKNVFTQVIADGFQSLSSPAMLMKMWAKKTSNFGSYSYLNESPVVFDQPFYNLRDEINRLAYNKALGSKGYTFETSTAKFSSGLPQYFIMKYLCDPFEDLDKEINAFYTDCFPTCPQPIRKIFNAWYFNSGYTQTSIDRFSYLEDDLAQLWKYIDDATKYQNDNMTIARLDELKIYYVYLFKLSGLTSPGEVKKMYTDPAYKTAKFNDILSYTWKYYNTFLFHNAMLSDMLVAIAEQPSINSSWNMHGGNILKNIDNSHLSTEQLFSQLKPSSIDRNNDPFARLEDSTLNRLSAYTAENIRIQLIDAEALISYTGVINIYNPIPGEIIINYNYTPSKKMLDNPGFISLQSDDYHEVQEQQISRSAPSGTIKFTMKRKGHYTLLFGQNQYSAATFTIKPGKSLLYINKKMLPVNCILLTDTTSNPADNAYLGMYTGTGREINYHAMYFNSPNTFHFFNASGVPLKQVIKNASPLYCSLTTNTDILYFKSDFFRWPPVFNNVAPYFFFFKGPKIQ